MSDRPIKKKIPRKKKSPVFSYDTIGEISSVDIQAEIDRAFSILFDEMAKLKD
jgi:hypothetical protein